MKDPHSDKAVAGEDNRMKNRHHEDRKPVTVDFGHNSLGFRVVQVVDAKARRRRQSRTQIGDKCTDSQSMRGAFVDLEGCCKAAEWDEVSWIPRSRYLIWTYSKWIVMIALLLLMLSIEALWRIVALLFTTVIVGGTVEGLAFFAWE